MMNPDFQMKHNLPPQSTPFIGRSPEINEIVGLIDDPACRLITLVGSGGMGKTRLALEVAHQIIIRETADSAQKFANGVYFITLQPITSPELIASTIAESIGFSFHGQDNPKAQLLAYLRDRQLLLILDNFEHVLDGADLMGDILQVAPHVQILVTSREALNLQEEWVRKVRGMRVPDTDQLDQIEAYSAVKLFMDRAHQIRGDFSPDDEQACVIRVCRLVGGMPLAIELAAAWLKRLTCADVANEIERNLDFLTTRMRNVPERHRSMRAVFEHSWNLLEKDERAVFKQCAVFRGGFRREAAEAVADASLLTLSSLVDKSMLRMTPTGRYEIHELLRQFAEEKLDEIDGAKDDAQDRHCEYYSDYLYQRQDNSRNAHQVEFMEEIEADIENIRSAWDWAITYEKWDAIEKALDSLERFYTEKSWYVQGEHTLAAASTILRSDHPTGLRGRVFGHVLARQGFIVLFFGEFEKAKQLALESLSILHQLNASSETFYSLWTMALIAHFQSKFDEAKEWAQQAHVIAKGNNDHWETAMALGTNAGMIHALGDYRDAKQLIQDVIKLCRQINDVWGIAWFLHDLSRIYLELGEFKEAQLLSTESLTLAQKSKTSQVTLWALIIHGKINHARGIYDEAKQQFHDCLQIANETGTYRARVQTLQGLGQIALAQQDYEEAQHLFEQCQSTGGTQLARVLHGLGQVSYALGQYERAKTTYLDCLAEYKESDWRLGIARIHNDLGTVSVALNHNHDAQQYFHEALKEGLEMGVYPTVLETLVGIAQLFATQDNLEQAIELLALALHHPTCHADTKINITRLLAPLEKELPSEIYNAPFERGKANDLDAVAVSLLDTLSGLQTDEDQKSSRVIDQPLVDPLSERELEVLALIAEGLSNREISERLFLTVGTIKVHASNIYSKLDVGKRTEAVARARDLGLL